MGLKGWIKFDTLADFLPQMKKSQRKQLSLVEVHPLRKSTQSYNKFCQYYRELDRGAVIDMEKAWGVTMYVMPVVENLPKNVRKKVFQVFRIDPPLGVMWAVVITFPDIVKDLQALTQPLPSTRAQPSAAQIASRTVVTSVDPRRADPRRADPRDPRAKKDPRQKPEPTS